MIISDFELEKARQRAISSIQPYERKMDADAPSLVRVQIHLPGGKDLPMDKFVAASLFYLEDAPSSDEHTELAPSAADAAVAVANMLEKGAVIDVDAIPEVPLLDGPPVVQDPVLQEEDGPAIVELEEEGDGEIDQWHEVEHLYISAATARVFASFGHMFSVMSRFQLRVEFYLVETNRRGKQMELDIGHAVTTLKSILDAPNERLDVKLMSMSTDELVGQASFSVEWIRNPAAILAFQIRIRVNRREGWPFATHRPFFMLYRLEYDGQWTPLYLSEVRVKATDHPDARGSMMYSIAEVDVQTANGGDDNRTLRIEFSHYKNSFPHHKLLGFVTTSVTAMRQAAANGDLNLQVNTFPSAELVGSVTIEKSRFTLSRAFFSIQADFGGPVQGHFVYVDMSLAAFQKGRFMRSSVFTSTRPYYQISRVNPGTGSWDVVYKSEGSSKYAGRKLFKYEMAKVTASKLCGGDPTCPLIISLHRSQTARIGHVSRVLPISFATVGSHGFMQLDRKEVTAEQTFISLRVVLGRDNPISMSDTMSSSSSGAIIEYGMDDLMTTRDSGSVPDPVFHRPTKVSSPVSSLTD
jgi:hypothetical protein